MTLYNKYRPRTFSDVKGHKTVVGSITSKLQSGNFPHAYIMAGQKGTGKTTIAKLIGQYLACESPRGFEPCNECKSCKASINEAHSDIYEIDGASNNGVSDIRRLKDEINYPPINSKHKIYIIDEVHMLSIAAFNALLKTIENPPEYVVFILATTELHKVPGTIRSRCEIHSFSRMSDEIISSRLKYIAQNENITLTPEASNLLAKNSDGSMRDSISILGTMCHHKEINENIVMEALGLIDTSLTLGFIDAMLSKDRQSSLAIYQSILSKGKSISQLIESIIQLLVVKIMHGEKIEEYSNFLKAINEYKNDYAKERNLQFMFNLFIVDFTNEVLISNTENLRLQELTDKVNSIEEKTNSRLERIESWIRRFVEKKKSSSQQNIEILKSNMDESYDTKNENDLVSKNEEKERTKNHESKNLEQKKQEQVKQEETKQEETIVNNSVVNAVDDILSRLSSFGS